MLLLRGSFGTEFPSFFSDIPPHLNELLSLSGFKLKSISEDFPLFSRSTFDKVFFTQNIETMMEKRRTIVIPIESGTKTWSWSSYLGFVKLALSCGLEDDTLTGLIWLLSGRDEEDEDATQGQNDGITSPSSLRERTEFETQISPLLKDWMLCFVRLTKDESAICTVWIFSNWILTGSLR